MGVLLSSPPSKWEVNSFGNITPKGSLDAHLLSGTDVNTASLIPLHFGNDTSAGYNNLPLRFLWDGDNSWFALDEGTGAFYLNLRVGILLSDSVQTGTITVTTLSDTHVPFSVTGDLSGSANFTYNYTNHRLALGATGSSAGLLIGGDALWYRSAADEMRTPDGLVIDGTAAFGTAARDSRFAISVARTTSANESGRGIYVTNTLTGTISGTFPNAINASVSINAGANTISYTAGLIASTRDVAGQSGTISEMYGLDFDAWKLGSENVGTLVGGRAFVTNRVSTGTITAQVGFRASMDSAAGSVSTVTDSIGFDYVPTFAGTGTHSRATGLFIRNNGSGGTAAGTVRGIWISDLTWGSTNYAISLDGTSGLERQGVWWNGDTVIFRAAANTLGIGASDSLQFNAGNIITDTTTGTKIGTGTTQKLGFWNATPVVQNTGWTTSNVSSDKVLDANSTTIDELADVVGTLIDTLKTYGILGA
jgi:hypothetical protein